ncbi:unnamed protein product [Choristocarpus tenellus]
MVAYEVTVDHAGYARGVTAGFPGAKKDEIFIGYDGAIQKLRVSPTYIQLEYNPKDSHGNYYTEKGAYVLVNGGYHKWKVHNMPLQGICHTGSGKVERTSGECMQGYRVRFWQSQGPIQNPHAATAIFAQEEDRLHIFHLFAYYKICFTHIMALES